MLDEQVVSYAQESLVCAHTGRTSSGEGGGGKPRLYSFMLHNYLTH